MPISCPHCAAEMPDTAAYCPGCGRSMLPVERAQGMVGILPETLAGALAYFLLPVIGFLLVEPYKKNRFVRFHCFQCLGFFLVGVVVVATLRVLGFLLYFVPVIGHFLIWLVSMVVALAFFIIWVVLIVKALQGEMFKLPLVGDFAEQQTPAA
ncbi:MAG: zinc-ribbon domain-containing protein [Candidatus Sulfotelmatobacter sp.]